MANETVGTVVDPALEFEFGRIRDFASRHGLSAEQIVAIFETKVRAASRLKPELFKLDEAQSDLAEEVRDVA